MWLINNNNNLYNIPFGSNNNNWITGKKLVTIKWKQWIHLLFYFRLDNHHHHQHHYIWNDDNNNIAVSDISSEFLFLSVCLSIWFYKWNVMKKKTCQSIQAHKCDPSSSHRHHHCVKNSPISLKKKYTHCHQETKKYDSFSWQRRRRWRPYIFRPEK